MLDPVTISVAMQIISIAVEAVEDAREGKITNEEAQKRMLVKQPEWQAIEDAWFEGQE